VGLEWGPFSLVSTTEELFETKCSVSGIENREYGCRDLSMAMQLETEVLLGTYHNHYGTGCSETASEEKRQLAGLACETR
jgi:hypothetical protein